MGHSLTIQLDPKKVVDLYQKYGRDYVNVWPNMMRQAIKQVRSVCHPSITPSDWQCMGGIATSHKGTWSLNHRPSLCHTPSLTDHA